MKKKKITYKNIIAILFSIIVFGYFITIGERFVRSSFFNHNFDDTIQSETEVANDAGTEATDWSKIYPIQDGAEVYTPAEDDKAEAETSGKFGGIKTAYTNFVVSVEDRIDYYTSKLLFMRMKFVEMNGRFNKIIGNKLISGSDDVIVMGDGNLTYYPFEYDLTKSAENLSEFSEFAESCGSKLLYVQAPCKVDPENNYLPNGITDWDNKNADSLLSMLKESGVNCLDLRKSMKKQGMNFTESFYKTDHHWKINVGLWASGQIAESLSEYGLPYRKDLLDINNYNEKVYEKYMFGSLGKKVSLAFAEPEDFSLLTPKFDTDYTVNYYDFRTVSGSFKDTLIDMRVLDKIDYYNKMVYSSYLYGINPIALIENHKADNDKRILFISDSFGGSVIPFLSTQVRYIDIIDLRFFNGGIKSFIEKNKPDVVVIMYYPTTLTYSEYFSLNFK